MSKLPFRLAPLLLLAVCATVALATSAEASTPCSTKRPTARDERELRAVVRKAAGARTSQMMIQDFCGHGYYSAVVDLLSPAVRQRHGVRDWSTIHCQRGEAAGWVCEELIAHRAVRLSAILGGSKRVIDVEFPPQMAVTTARDLAVRALSVVEDPAAQPTRCPEAQRRTHASHPWSEARDALLKSVRDLPVPVVVWTQDNLASETPQVWLDASLAIEFPSGCWIEVDPLIVT